MRRGIKKRGLGGVGGGEQGHFFLPKNKRLCEKFCDSLRDSPHASSVLQH